MALCALACLAGPGCATQWKEHQILHIPHTVSYGKYPPKKVAILPFENVIDPEHLHSQAIALGQVKEPRPPEAIAREALYKHFSILPFEDVELREVNKAIEGADTLNARIKAVREKLGVDTVVMGRLKLYHHSYWFVFAYSSAAADVKMINVKTGETIWSSDHFEWGLSFSILLDVWDLAICGYKEYIWRRELRRRFDDLFNDMVKTIPERQAQLRPKEKRQKPKEAEKQPEKKGANATEEKKE